MKKYYLCIDLKTFYASVECVERGLDPFATNLVVADPSRGKGALCLAISPQMKMLGVKNRCRLFEIPPNIDYMIAVPRMKKYIEYSSNIYAIYLKYFSKEDIHVYSIDEAFMDISSYLKLYNKGPIELAKIIMEDIYDTYGITSTAGIGTNMFLSKVAMDIIAKHNVSNLEWLDEAKYQELLWHHKPLTDFWQIGHGIERRLAKMRLFDMYDVAHCKENRLYKEFGINAKYLINHAWGREDCTIEQIKRYRPKRNSLSNSQILFEDYPFEKARLILKEMVELGSLRLIKNNLVTNNISLYIGYSRDILPPVGAMLHFDNFTNVYTELVKQFLHIYDTKVNPRFMIRRIGISFNDVVSPGDVQLSLFVDQLKIDKERNLELAIGNLRNKLGKNAVIRGMNLEEGATTIIRNKLIGGHNAE